MSTPNTYDIGDIVTLTCLFYSDEAMTVLADPDEVDLVILDPYDALVAGTLPLRTSQGRWDFDYTPAIGGMHQIRWTGEGAVQAAEQEQIFVRRVNTA